jgi:YHS domain-containing protein
MKPERAVPVSSLPADMTARDPVCGMSVTDGKATWTTVHDGRTYYFCSAHCKATFVKTPEKYAVS